MIKTLFVSSGNSKAGINPIVRSQGESLKRNGIDLDYYPIVGKGTKGYLKNIPRLSKYIANNNYNIIHAHYSLSSIVASISCKLPMVVSLMGSDTHMIFFWKLIIRMFYRFRWDVTIVKSIRMKKNNCFYNAAVIPNGVNFELFKPIEKEIAKMKVGFNDKKRHIIFVANPQNSVKNYKLAKKAVKTINNGSVELNTVSNVDQNIVSYYMNAADVLLLTSLREGSPNVIKEAMACNCPIVSTDVGDVKELIRNTEGCYMSSYDPEDVAEKLKKAIAFGKRTDGRNNIQHLESSVIGNKVIDVYNKVLS
jgi:glycosyltransferase involved in cell wall biosynthesis